MGKRAEKTEFAKDLAARLGVSERMARQVVDGVLGLLIERMRRDGGVALWGLGRFEVVEVAAQPHRYRNPRTGEASQQTEHPRSVRFRPAKSLRERLD